MEQSYKKLNPKAKIAMVLSSIQISLIVALILIVIRTIVHLFEITSPIHRSLDLVFLLILAIPVLKILLSPTIGYKRHAYMISDLSVDKITGIINIERQVVPIRRMQQINIESDWINRIFGLADIHIITAGGDMVLEYIELEEALEIADNLKNIIHEIALIQAQNKEDE